MLGPLPTYYRVVVSACALLSFVGIGAWLGYLMPDTVLASVGTGIGAGLGVAAILLLLHDPEQHAQPHRARFPRHH